MLKVHRLVGLAKTIGSRTLLGCIPPLSNNALCTATGLRHLNILLRFPLKKIDLLVSD